ncbi:hypothetical protein QW131_15935 [Roseibium salinum]|nr:hypothetical protein [Roseibium salinum]
MKANALFELGMDLEARVAEGAGCVAEPRSTTQKEENNSAAASVFLQTTAWITSSRRKGSTALVRI